MCPFLGLSADERTAMAYPSTQNFCHHVLPPTVPSAGHQRKFCLDGIFAQCPLYQAQTLAPMPADIRPDKPRKKRRPIPRVWILLALVLLATVIAIALMLNQPPSAAASGGRVSPAALTDPAGLPTAQPTASPQPTHTSTAVPPTQTFTPQPLHLMETPIGTDRQFLIHRVLDGESLISLAAAYFTTPEAIRAVNYAWSDSLWANSTLVIPLNQSDVSAVAPMTALAVDEDGLTIEQIAQGQSVDVSALCSLNALPAGYIFHSGEWVLIPHGAVTP